MRIALLEDDPDQAQLLQLWLDEAGHVCEWSTTGAEFQRSVRAQSFDLVILDWILPDTSGDQMLSWYRSYIDRQVPILFVTSRDSEEDIVRALELGADDYMIKPVRHRELLARVIALSRRIQPSEPEAVEIHGPFEVNNFTHTITRMHDQEPVPLTPREFELAVFLLRNTGRLLSRDYILESVWGRRPDLNTRTVDTHVSRLRRKLHLDPEHGCVLSSIYNHGYRLEFRPEAEVEAEEWRAS